ncbi:MAG: hypothetical protein EP329_08990 [Deltaproteobacteria bacterium]|nr:MAG: hypothetical protein EP329_08990 [Deltaproteobacteria bacterium]
MTHSSVLSLAVALAVVLATSSASAEEAAPASEAAQGCGDEASPVPSTFEITIGTSMSFPAEELFDRTDATQLVPTSALLASAELFLDPRLRLIFTYRLPTASEVRQVGDVVEQRVLESTVELGAVVVPYWIDFATKSRVELQVFATVGVEMDNAFRAFPRLGYRINLMQDAAAGIGVFFGMSYAFRLDRFALLYGVGYRF